MCTVYNCLDSEEKWEVAGNHLHCYRHSKFSENKRWNFRNITDYFCFRWAFKFTFSYSQHEVQDDLFQSPQEIRKIVSIDFQELP